MAAGELLNRDEEARLVKLIREVERATTGEVRIHIAKRTSLRGAMRDAARIFKKLDMSKTEHRNGVLIFVSVRDREAVILGDKGIHEKIGHEGWNKHLEQLLSHFKKGDFHLGLHQAIESIGETLKKHFPAEDRHHNELPDDISHS